MHSKHYVALALLWLLPFAAWAQTATLSCTAPTQNTNGSPLTNLVSYKWYWGTALGNYPNQKTTPSSAGCNTVIDGLTDATWFFAVTAVNTSGIESSLSNAASKVVELPPGPVRNLDVQVVSVSAARFVRWTVKQRRGATVAFGNSIQVADLELMLGANPVAWPSGTVATNPGGSNPGNEQASNLVDANAATKVLDFNFSSSPSSLTGTSVLLIDAGVPVAFDGVRYRTANDAPERDPLGWTIETAPDSAGPWTVRATVTNAAIPTARGEWTGTFASP